MMCPLLLAVSLTGITFQNPPDVIDRLHNGLVIVPPDESFAPQLLHPTPVELLELRDQAGEPALRARLLPMLNDPDRYAAAHLALWWVASPCHGPMYGGGVEPLWADRTRPGKWRGRQFFYGLERNYDESERAATIVRPAETMARLSRYWEEYFAGVRSDFRVLPPIRGYEDPRSDRSEPAPLRPKDDPLPAIEAPAIEAVEPENGQER